MKYDVFYTDRAREDLEDIYGYIAFGLFEPLTAQRMTRSIIEAARSLEEFPQRNGLYDHEPWRSAGLRKLLVKNYIIFHTVNEENKAVTIIRIMYGGRDIKKQLGE